MKRGIILGAWMFLAAGGVGLVSAQEPAHVEDMRFVQALRQRGDHDLALVFLQQMAKTLPPALAIELPLELAKTRLAAASEELDTAKRLAMYVQAREDFEKFLAANKGHPRAAEARLDITEVAVMQGRTQLSKALAQDTPEGRTTEGAKARLILEDAGNKLKEAHKELKLQLEKLDDPKTPQEKATKARLEEEKLRAELNIGLNLFDQGLSFPREDAKQAVLIERGKRIEAAKKELAKLGGGNENNSVTWVAKAWQGRCERELDNPTEARRQFTTIIDAASRNTKVAEGYRLARYFRMLVIEEDATDKTKIATLEDAGTRWLKDYPRLWNTPEGYGVRFSLAKVHLAKTEDPKLPKEQVAKELEKARVLLRDLELSENEFSDRARRLKIDVVVKQGGFSKKIEQLKTFDECFLRAQFEIDQVSEDIKKQPTAKPDDLRKVRIESALAALDRGLNLPEVKDKNSPEINKARSMQVYFCFNSHRYRDAIKAGEKLARTDPKSPQAPSSATFAIQAYSQLLAEKEAMQQAVGDLKNDKGEKVSAEQFAADLEDDRSKMIDFTRYVLERWPKETAGDLARHQMALMLSRKKDVKEEDKAKNTQEAIKYLGAINSTYPSYVFSQYLLAKTAMQAEKEKLEPIKDAGPVISYRQRAIAALESIPDQASTDPQANLIFLLGKCELAEEYYKEKKFDQMDKLAIALLPKLGTMKLSDADEKDKEYHEGFHARLVTIQLFARYGLADAAFTKGEFPKVAELLDPLIDEMKAKPDHPAKNNKDLAQGLLGMSLRTSIQTGNLERARLVIQVLQQVSPEDPAARGSPLILRQMVGLIQKQMEDLQHKGDQEAIKKAKAGFSAILDELTKNANVAKNKSVVLTLAQCYSNMDLHPKAVELLSKLPEPKEAAGMNIDEETRLLRGARLMYIKELRLNKELDKAKSTLDAIMGTKEKPGWGARNVDALKEGIYLLADQEKYFESHNRASALAKQMLPKVDKDNAIKGHYIDCYYQMVYCLVKIAHNQKDLEKKDKTFADAAKLIDQLYQKFPAIESDTTSKRFQDLLKNEPGLKMQYDKIKKPDA
jgi:tetratricopeptide (TPR) repeat protein